MGSAPSSGGGVMPTVTVRGTRHARAHVRMVKQRAGNAMPAWPQVGNYLSRLMRQQFTSKGARLGTPWRPLKPEYLLWKRRNGFPASILVREGKLKDSFVGRPMGVEIYTTDTAVFGSNEQTAIWHHNGTRRNGKRVNPPRPLLRVTPEVRREVRDILAKHVTGGRVR